MKDLEPNHWLVFFGFLNHKFFNSKFFNFDDWDNVYVCDWMHNWDSYLNTFTRIWSLFIDFLKYNLWNHNEWWIHTDYGGETRSKSLSIMEIQDTKFFERKRVFGYRWRIKAQNKGSQPHTSSQVHRLTWHGLRELIEYYTIFPYVSLIGYCVTFKMQTIQGMHGTPWWECMILTHKQWSYSSLLKQKLHSIVRTN